MAGPLESAPDLFVKLLPELVLESFVCEDWQAKLAKRDVSYQA
jgi:hypothetical protein